MNKTNTTRHSLFTTCKLASLGEVIGIAGERTAIVAISTYSPRRQWTTRHGAVFTERAGFAA